MAKRKLIEKLLYIDDIGEEMVLINGSNTDYITPTAKVYKDYGDGYFYPKNVYQNKNNLYLYVGITMADGKNRNRRLHRLLAEAYIPNPNPDKLKYVGHKDNVKWNCTIDNLYWTSNLENSQKAVDDNLSVNDCAENDSQSIYIKVIDYNTNEIVGVYGSIGQCANCIENIDKAFIAKVCKNSTYKPRSRKYVYAISNKDEFENYQHLQNSHLVESKRANKNPKVFRMINDSMNYDETFDNQTRASKICGIPQAVISRLIKTGEAYNGWKFIYIDSIEYKNSTAYKNMIGNVNNVVIKNINTGEKLSFNCKHDMLEYFGIKGNAASEYFDKNYTIMHEWKVV